MSDKLDETNNLSEDCRQLFESLALQTISWGPKCRKISDFSRKEMILLIDNKNKQKSNSYQLVLKHINQELALFSLFETKSSLSGQEIVSKSATLSVERRLLFGIEERIQINQLFPMSLLLDLFFNVSVRHLFKTFLFTLNDLSLKTNNESFNSEFR